MNLYAMLKKRHEAQNPVRIGLIGSGKFGSMFLSQVRHLPGMHLLGIADLSVARAREALANTGWPVEDCIAADPDEALRTGRTCLTEDAEALIRFGGLEVVIDATGSPAAGIRHALLAAENGHHMIMVNVEADVLWPAPISRANSPPRGGSTRWPTATSRRWCASWSTGPAPAASGSSRPARARSTCPPTPQVDARRRVGSLRPDAGGGGGGGHEPADVQLLPRRHQVGDRDGGDRQRLAASSRRATASASRRAASHDLPEVLKPREAGGMLEQAGMVEVVSSLERDGRPVTGDLRWGVYVVFEAIEDRGQGADYVRRCFREYQVVTDRSGRYATLYRPSHLIGLELGISVASAALRHEPTGATAGFVSDVVAVSKKALAAGDRLDGEGGYTVWGRLARAGDSLAGRALPIGLADGMRLRHAVPEGQVVTWDDVEVQETQAIRVRRAMEDSFRQAGPEDA
jgi:predicted homoserine dehydrogenase-like protein